MILPTVGRTLLILLVGVLGCLVDLKFIVNPQVVMVASCLIAGALFVLASDLVAYGVKALRLGEYPPSAVRYTLFQPKRLPKRGAMAKTLGVITIACGVVLLIVVVVAVSVFVARS